MPYLTIIKKIAKEIREDYTLSPKEKYFLITEGSKLLKRVQKNIKNNNDIFSNLSFNDKTTLLSYIIFLRQNISITQGDNTNEEDSALILHKKIYKNKKDEKILNKNLKKQLSKIGIKKD